MMSSEKTKLHEKTLDDDELEYETRKDSVPRKLLVIVLIVMLMLILSMRHCGSPPSPYNPLATKQARTSLSSLTPEQLHLSLGHNDTEYYVVWSIRKPVKSYLVWWPSDTRKLSARQWEQGQLETRVLVDEDAGGQRHYKHSYRAKMDHLKAGQAYTYMVVACSDRTQCKRLVDSYFENDYFASLRSRLVSSEDTSNQSNQYTFVAHNLSSPDFDFQAIFFGDLGLINGQSTPRLIEEAKRGLNHLMIHNGDFAYDLNTEHGEYGDRFMRMIEPFAARLPYQVSVGNHEIANNFSEYNARFMMVNRAGPRSGQHNNFFYSFNVGPVHFVAFSTEFYYFLNSVGVGSLVDQYNWLKEDLALASTPSERLKRPWIVVFGHRPMYCSSRDGDDCSKDNNILRRGLPPTGAYALEKLFYEFGVDLELYSHEHQYERFLPIYDGAVFNGTSQPDRPYHNARAPVHIISGSAGCQERLDPFKGQPATGSIKQISDYGYTRLRASRCALSLEQVSDDQEGSIVDKVVISKSRQSFPPNAQPITYESCPDN